MLLNHAYQPWTAGLSPDVLAKAPATNPERALPLAPQAGEVIFSQPASSHSDPTSMRTTNHIAAAPSPGQEKLRDSRFRKPLGRGSSHQSRPLLEKLYKRQDQREDKQQEQSHPPIVIRGLLGTIPDEMKECPGASKDYNGKMSPPQRGLLLLKQRSRSPFCYDFSCDRHQRCVPRRPCHRTQRSRPGGGGILPRPLSARIKAGEGWRPEGVLR